MKPYVSLFYKDNNKGHSSMPRRVEKTYISVYDQNFNSSRRTKKILERNLRNGKNAKTAIPQKNVSIKESDDDKMSKPNIIQPIININIINGENMIEILQGVINCIKANTM